MTGANGEAAKVDQVRTTGCRNSGTSRRSTSCESAASISLWSDSTRHEKRFFYVKLHMEKGCKSSLASSSKRHLQLELRCKQKTKYLHQTPSASPSRVQKLWCPCVALPQQLALSCAQARFTPTLCTYAANTSPISRQEGPAIVPLQYVF